MQNYGYLPNSSDKTFIYIGSCPITDTTTFHTWTIPDDARFVSFTCIGAGAGGGPGFGAASGNTKGGGGGGGSGGIGVSQYLANRIPKTLYLYATGGGEGATSTNGEAGTISMVTGYPDISQSSIRIAISGNAAALGGAIGTGAGPGTGGSGSTVATTALLGMPGMALSHNFLAGSTGGNGGAVTPSNGGTALINGSILSGGGGGGSCSAVNAESQGGSIVTGSSINLFWTNTVTIINRPAAATEGYAGLSNIEGGAWMREAYPRYSLGGSGAGGTATAAGKAGGNGGIGCGGGGGGAGTTNGAGGRGGAGAIIIEWW